MQVKILDPVMFINGCILYVLNLLYTIYFLKWKHTYFVLQGDAISLNGDQPARILRRDPYNRIKKYQEYIETFVNEHENNVIDSDDLFVYLSDEEWSFENKPSKPQLKRCRECHAI